MTNRAENAAINSEDRSKKEFNLQISPLEFCTGALAVGQLGALALALQIELITMLLFVVPKSKLASYAASKAIKPINSVVIEATAILLGVINIFLVMFFVLITRKVLGNSIPALLVTLSMSILLIILASKTDGQLVYTILLGVVFSASALAIIVWEKVHSLG